MISGLDCCTKLTLWLLKANLTKSGFFFPILNCQTKLTGTLIYTVSGFTEEI